MSSARSASLSAALMICFLCTARPAAAQPAPNAAVPKSVFEQAGELFDQGIAFYKQGRWVEAEAAFQKAWNLKQGFDIATNLGDCELKIGQAREATEHLAFAVTQFPVTGKPATRERLMKRYAEARQQISALTVRVNVEGAEVWVDGKKMGSAPLREVFVEPGKHAVEAKLGGYETAQESVEAEKGGRATVQLAMVKKDGAAPAIGSGGERQQEPPPPPPPVERGPRKEVLIAGGVTAGAALVAGVVFAVVANGKAGDFDHGLKPLAAEGGPSACVSGKFTSTCAALQASLQESDTFANASVWGFIGAGVIGSGTLIYALAAPKMVRDSGVRVAPVVAVQGGGVVVSSSW